MAGELLTHRAGVNQDVLVLTLSNPGMRNALHPDMYGAGIEVLSTAGHSKDVRAIVLTGADAFFCAGGNLNRLLANRQLDASVQHESVEQLGHWIDAIVSCPKPVIAAVEGVAAGAGLALALACDMVVAADNARFMAAYVRNGLSPDGGVTWLLQKLLPKAVAFECAMLGDPISAERLHALGVVNVLCAAKNADAAALALAERFAAGPQAAQASIKRLLTAASAQDLATHLVEERHDFVENLFAPDAGEGIAAFLAKRAPKYL